MSNATAMNSLLYSYMETAMVVREVAYNLDKAEELDEDILSSETDTDFLETLVHIAMEIEDENQRHECCYTLEDLREKAEPMILKEYGKEPEKRIYTIRRDYWKEVKVEAATYEEAIRQATEAYMFDDAKLEPGDTEVCEVNGVPV